MTGFNKDCLSGLPRSFATACNDAYHSWQMTIEFTFAFFLDS
ncbi:hypothetical protein [Helicobacter fennelliae]|uniref:Uncharacterized protein n=1 Tax=Helicobacter fennelliae MRY12-0050 TaxID=1325130 RepID=T1DVV4_9HELI|nr:hypothetical protein [Helicobacter fennelliae]GAD18872.1 hypothetical protein HFN_0003 [Helicobacter fennelliae MRY12-0050]